MQQSWGQLVMFDSLFNRIQEDMMAKAQKMTGGTRPVTLDLKRAIMDEQADKQWQQALLANKMSKAADRSRRNAEHARRDSAASIIQARKSPFVVPILCRCPFPVLCRRAEGRATGSVEHFLSCTGFAGDV